MKLTLDRLSKQFKNKIAVDHVNAELGPGVYGFLGANGAGKTTLMQMICGIIAPTSGEVLLNAPPSLTSAVTSVAAWPTCSSSVDEASVCHIIRKALTSVLTIFSAPTTLFPNIASLTPKWGQVTIIRSFVG